MSKSDEPDNFEITMAAEASNSDSPHRRKHKKYRYRGQRDIKRKFIVTAVVIASWAALLAGWYFLTNLPRR
jgi:hypothetical protein